MLAVATDAGIASGAQLGLEASSCCARGRQADFRIHRPFMPYIQLNDSQYPLFVGETHVGRGVGADILIPGSEAEETELIAVVTLGDDHAATIAGASDTFPVKVNGIVLGREASPLQHGDRIELAGVQLRFADELQGMITHPMPTVPLATGVPPVQRTGEAALTGGQCAPRDAVLRLPVQALRLRRRSAPLAQFEHRDRVFDLLAGDIERVTRTQHARRFGALAIDMHLAAADGRARGCARLEKAGSP